MPNLDLLPVSKAGPLDSNCLPKVAILLCTYNGSAYLREQLDSFCAQTESNWVLWVSDDGSLDGTMAILQEFADRTFPGRVNIVKGPQLGFAANFLSLIHNPLKHR